MIYYILPFTTFNTYTKFFPEKKEKAKENSNLLKFSTQEKRISEKKKRECFVSFLNESFSHSLVFHALESKRGALGSSPELLYLK